jgi:hypothetical protein
MSVDLSRPDAAEDHTAAAWLCAERADHDGLRAWVRATQHQAARWQDDFGRAAEYAADGLRYATGTAALILASAYAMDLARSGQHEQAWDALRQAWAVAETADPTQDELAGPFTCPSTGPAARSGRRPSWRSAQPTPPWTTPTGQSPPSRPHQRLAVTQASNAWCACRRSALTSPSREINRARVVPLYCEPPPA